MPLSLQESYEHCRRITLEADSNFALSFRFLPKEKQDAIYSVYAFNRLADDFADEPEMSDDPLKSLQKWEELLEDCYAGREVENPVMIAFSDAIKKYRIPIKPFKDAIEGFKMDLSINRYKTFEDLAVYCDRVAGTISIMSLHIFGWKDESVFEYGQNLSYALQLTNIIRDVGKDIEKDRIYIPLDEIEQFGYSEAELMNREDNGNFKKLMEFQVERARSYYHKAEPLIKLVERDSQYTVTMIGAVYSRILKKISSLGIPSLHRATSLSTFEKAVTAFRMKLFPTFK